MTVAKVGAVVVTLLLCLAGMAGACIPPPKWASMPGSASAPPVVVLAAATAPRSPVVDWRAHGAVTTPINQGRLDSCWAISAAGAIEGLRKIQTGTLERLSSQQIFDCADPRFLHHRSKAFDWVHRNGGVASDAAYPYTGRHQPCKREMLKKITASIRGYMANVNSEADLLKAVARQPVAIVMQVDERAFHAYRGGIFTGPCGDGTDLHAMLAVGYGEAADGTKFWIIKNSWGVHWGDQGYMYVKRGPDAGLGLCGLAYNGAYPF